MGGATPNFWSRGLGAHHRDAIGYLILFSNKIQCNARLKILNQKIYVRKT